MGQVSRKYDHDTPNVRSRCIFAKLYKANKRLDQRGDFGIRKIGDRTEPAIVPSFSDKTRGQTLS